MVGNERLELTFVKTHDEAGLWKVMASFYLHITRVKIGQTICRGMPVEKLSTDQTWISQPNHYTLKDKIEASPCP